MSSINIEQPSSTGSRVLPLTSPEQIVQANGVDLCVQTFGDPGDPAILLIMGGAASMLGWEDGFCQRLAAGSRFVIRYDHRDTGRSVSYEPGAPPYTFRDLVADAVGLLDTFGLDRAHVVGMSMGSEIGQHLALDHRDRVASLTLISTNSGEPDLPPPSEEFLAFAAGAEPPDWSDRAAVIDYLVAFERAGAARSRPFDEAARRDLAGRVFDRTTNIASSLLNHFAMEADEPAEPFQDRLGGIRVPTLVMHGEEDPVFPVDHALALARAIPGAEPLTLEQMGHELPPAVWDVVVPAIVRHTAS